MNTCTGPNEMNVTPAPRGVVNQPVVQNHSSRNIVEQYIRKAIEDGDNLGSTDRPVPEGGVRRRALIIAPEYEDYPDDQLPTLSATATDVQLVHELLVTFGYERKNIRILCDVCAGNGYSYPTRKNILDSLKWLTSDLTPNAYRFLHFSGHGIRIPSDDKRGKAIRDSDWNPYKEPQTLDTERSGSEISSQRIKEQTVLKKELNYYNEAIATRKDVSDKDQPRDVILDSQLNLCLAELPPDCTITCTLDCCASGRMLNLPVKVAGTGFRGGSSAQSTDATLSPCPDVPEDSSCSLTESGQLTGSRGKPTLTTADGSKTQNNLDDSTGQVYLQENLPETEKQMNHVRARILSWSASHQRQEAWVSNDGHTGLFTRAFTEACLNLKNNQISPGFFNYQQLYDEVRRFVELERRDSRSPRPQFVQLWSSLEDDEQATKDDLMKSRVVL